MYKAERKMNPETDDKNWQILFDTQFENLQKDVRISKLWINGLSKLGIDQSKVPNVEYLNKILAEYTGWKLLQTNDTVIMSTGDWSKLITEQKMPMTNFVRTPEELYYCDEPDKWHDIIGHVPFFFDEEYTKMYINISNMYLEAEKKGEPYTTQAYNILSLIIEVGLIRENGRLKALGTTLYSSAGELESAFTEGNYEDFTLEKILPMGYYDRGVVQKRYFIVDSIDHINQIVEEYRIRYLR
jgi:phenylalanine-4-hydroxylase